MKPNYTFNQIAIVIVAVVINTSYKNMQKKATPPIADKIEKKLLKHGHQRIDNYYWMRHREDEKVIEHLHAENAYTSNIMKNTEDFQHQLFDEIVGRIKQTDESVPYKKNGYYYYTRYEEGFEYPVFCRKKENLSQPEEIILNVNKLAEGTSYCQVAGFTISPDNKMLAYGIDTVSRRLYTIRVVNLETGETYTDVLKNTHGRAYWANDNKTLFYTHKDENTLRHDKIYKHKLGTSSENDELIYSEEDETFYTGVYKSKSDDFLFIYSDATLTSEIRYLNANTPDAPFKIFQPRERGHEYSVAHMSDKFIIRTNKNARNFKLMETPLTSTGIENWTEIIPHRNDVLLESFELFEYYLVIDERIKGLTHLRIIDYNNNNEHYVSFGEETYTAWISVNPEFKSHVLRIGFSSLTTPTSTYDYNMQTKEKTLLKQQEVVGGYSPNDYHAERHFATATDGTKIPISLVYKKGLEKNGKNPLLLYGYGSYGHTIDPSFSSVKLSLINRGFVYAIAHVRGGQIMGRHWYEDGKLLKKKNTFTDFISCAQYLIDTSFTSPEYLFAMGGSAGGLLMGAVINMRPELFNGVVAGVPFVDVVTTMLDDEIPLTTGEYDEWGNPNEKKYYDYMLSYSPYDNVTKQDYPNILVTTGLHDSQVQYWEPVKWVAKLRELKTDENILLLHINMEAGHGGASGRFERFRETALEYAFMFKLLGIYK